MSKQLIDVDPLSGLETWFDYNPSDDTTIIEYRQDCTPLLDHNKAMANEAYRDGGIKNGFWHYATIPTVVQYKWLKEHGVDIHKPEHEKKMFQLLNSPDYRYLKTTFKHHGGNNHG